MKNYGRIGRGFAPLPRLALLAALALPLAACDVDELLTINDPDVVDPSLFNDSTALPAFRGGALGDFSVAFDAAGGDNQVTYSGMLADEYINSETFPTRIAIDLRKMEETNSNIQGVTRTLYRARTSAEAAIAAYQRFSPGRATEPGAQTDPGNVARSEVFSLAAAVYMFFGEHYCSGVPFSIQNPDGSFSFGGQETTTQIFTRALERADSAVAVATRAPTSANQTNLLNLGRIMRGRALLNLNRPQEAADAVAGVPIGFNYVIFHNENTGRQNNGMFAFAQLSKRVSVANREGTNGLDYRSSADPRTPSVRPAGSAGIGFDGSTPQFNSLKYNSRSASTPLATGLEARLIVAEAQLRAGNAAYLTTLNELRTTPRQVFFNEPVLAGTGITPANTIAALPALTDPGTAAGRVDQLFRERAFWLWLTGHRLGDMRRLIRQYGRNQATVFPVGTYHKSGAQYGTDVNFPLSVDERNNPEFAQFPADQSLCLNREA